MSTVTVHRKCFLCSVEVSVPYFLTPHDSSIMSYEILEIPNWTNDVQKLRFEHVCYCRECYNIILKIRDMLEELKEFEKEILEEKYKIESKLIESCKESENAFIINEHGKLQKQPTGMLQKLRHEIVTKLGKNSIESMLEKIRKKAVARKYDCHNPSGRGNVQIMKNVAVPEILTQTEETDEPEKLKTHSCITNSHVSEEQTQYSCIANSLVSEEQSQCNPPNEIFPSPVKHQLPPPNDKVGIEHSKPKNLKLVHPKSSNDVVFEGSLPIPEPGFSLRNKNTVQVPPIKKEYSLRSTTRQIKGLKKSSKPSISEKTIGVNNLLKNYTKHKHKRHVKSRIDQIDDITIGSEETKNIFNKSKSRRLKEKKTVNPTSSQKIKVKRTLIKSNDLSKKRQTKCEKCGEIFPSYYSWERHEMIVHGVEPKFKCKLCKYSSGHKAHFTRHMLTHSKVRGVKCDLCSKILFGKEALHRHKKIHGGKFQCKICLSKFNHSPSLARHQIEVHGIKKVFKCDICFKIFKADKNLREHLKVHGGKFQCNICLSTFIYEFTLRKHKIEAHHG